ncbi:patatin-like phospholipase family protein [Ehrlichia chaffeensis str. Heartland]|nr:patatin-like phospholipase family protein [Ehrlichia chaffeensis]AHX06296.1 patatin-like phospholipase family protein [Ehrlichia chaffeensis str. Liberty]AHX10431.1 patatin-like phospholipase family protein [Ehrlichia chaffeensis str. West Paces]AHX03959.1 patatin-like phospholipase family protein [Ehrlichia chaffeensis str. Heartland]AHX05309.1 patatin-like phospholipase family protein [Ehrlichia chaffeensis str. Jax]AHX07915.1 patatin-like phospholipase family protein [Ehrlichia chaffeens
MTRYILSIDGGGVRGIVAATILQEIEKRINKPLSKIFDLVSGSSVGSLVGGALCLKNADGMPRYNTRDLLDLMLKYSGKIFSNSAARNAFALIFGPKYSDKNLNSVLKEIFGDVAMKDLMTNFIVPSYDLCSNQTVMFRSWVDKYHDIKVSDVTRGAVAAPTYFTPKKIIVEGKKTLLIDSSIVCNNPIIAAYAGAQVLYPNEKLCCLSVGCGTVNKDFSDLQNSLLYWSSKILFVIIDAGLDAIDYQMARLVKGEDTYCRISGDIIYSTCDFSDASPGNIQNVQKDAQKIVQENEKNINDFCEVLLNDERIQRL